MKKKNGKVKLSWTRQGLKFIKIKIQEDGTFQQWTDKFGKNSKTSIFRLKFKETILRKYIIYDLFLLVVDGSRG